MLLQIVLFCACVFGCEGRYAFFKDLHARAGSRRVFGGAAAAPGAFPAACALLDHSLAAHCSCAVVERRWAVTAAHCAVPKIAYVSYTPRAGEQRNAPVHLFYTHPQYRVEEKDEGAGMDVVLLHHDVALVRTRSDMAVAQALADPLRGMLEYDPDYMFGEEVELVGYGTASESSGPGSALRVVRLQVAPCARSRDDWRHCACASGDARGVCSGDSGGPVMLRGRQIGVTSMGPVQCAPTALVSADGVWSYPEAVSVFTALRPYVGLLNATIHELDHGTRMRALEVASKPRSVPFAYQTLVAAMLCHQLTLRGVTSFRG